MVGAWRLHLDKCYIGFKIWSMITYYLGAGASANRIPIVNGFTTPLEKRFAEQLKYMSFNGAKRSPEIDFMIRIHKILRQISSTWSVDTFAKNIKLEKDDYRFLKLIVATYLECLEVERGVDPRYDLLLSSIADKISAKNLKLHYDVNFISWNYDTQLERSIVNIMPDVLLSRILEVFNEKGVLFGRRKTFNIIKLNGSSSLYKIGDEIIWRATETINNVNLEFIPESRNFSRLVQDKYEEENLHSAIKYAWETNNEDTSWHKIAQSIISRTNNLVIVGYSFPDFNRDIDEFILSKIKLGTKIFIQCTSDHAKNYENETIFQRLKQILPEFGIEWRPVFINDNSRFFLPYEPKREGYVDFS